MTKTDALTNAMKEAAKSAGVDIRGKKYTVVAERVEIFRRHFGTEFGIVTDADTREWRPGQPVFVKASIIRCHDNAIIATGHACEIIGDGMINKGSALENAETSAIGRALAALGLHGGEYASVNEIDGHARKVEAAAPRPVSESSESDKGYRLALAAPPHEMDNVQWRQATDMFTEMITTFGDSVAALNDMWRMNKQLLDDLERADKGMYDEVVATFKHQKSNFSKGDK